MRRRAFSMFSCLASWSLRRFLISLINSNDFFGCKVTAFFLYMQIFFSYYEYQGELSHNDNGVPLG